MTPERKELEALFAIGEQSAADLAAQHKPVCTVIDEALGDGTTRVRLSPEFRGRLRYGTKLYAALEQPGGEPIYGDILPPIGSRVFIRHGRDDDAHACTVTGYYAWGDLGGNKHLSRVFVQLVYEGTSVQQARILCDCYPSAEAALNKAAPQPAQQPVQEPVYYRSPTGSGHYKYSRFSAALDHPEPLYTSPQPDTRTAAIQACIDHLIFGGQLAAAQMLRNHFAKDLGEG